MSRSLLGRSARLIPTGRNLLQETTILVRIHHEGRTYVIEAPAGARVVRTSEDNCHVYGYRGRQEFLLTPFAVMLARDGAKGLRLVSQGPTDLRRDEEGLG